MPGGTSPGGGGGGSALAYDPGVSSPRRLRDLRERIVARDRLAQSLWAAAIAILGVALVAALEISIALGVAVASASLLPLWLSGAWVLPGSEDAYYRQVQRLGLRWTQMVDWWSEGPLGPRSRRRRILMTLSPPPRLAHVKTKLLALADAAEELDRLMVTDVPEAAGRAAELWREYRAIHQEFQAVSSAGEDKGFAATIRRLQLEREKEYSDAVAHVDAEDEALLAGLCRLTPPTEAREDHERLLEVMNRYLRVSRELRETVERGEPVLARALAGDFEQSRAELQDCFARLAALSRLDPAAAARTSDPAPPEG